MRRRETVWAVEGLVRWHVVKGHGGVERAACGTDTGVATMRAMDVPEEDRCRAPGCRERWPALLRLVVG